MTARLAEIVVESHDPAAAAAFWAAALGWPLRRHQPGDVPWLSRSGDPQSHDLKLVFVSPRHDTAALVNRLYLHPGDDGQAEAIGLLESLGATTTAPGTPERPWVAMADPGGTDFTVLPGEAS